MDGYDNLKGTYYGKITFTWCLNINGRPHQILFLVNYEKEDLMWFDIYLFYIDLIYTNLQFNFFKFNFS